MKPPLSTRQVSHTSALRILRALVACLFLFLPTLPLQAQQQPEEQTAEQAATSSAASWFPDWSAPVGFTYTAGANMVSAYLWRGFCVGGAALQPNFNVGYGGFYAGAWWNIGATDNRFLQFFPEVDVYVGFSRCGFTLEVTHMHYFDHTPFFRFREHDVYGQGNSNNTELHFQYRVSDRLPLSLDWYTHIASSDGYVVDADGNYLCAALPEGADSAGLHVRRAFSSYLQIGYDFQLPHDIIIPVRVGMTPWKSRYTHFEGGATVNCISIGLEKAFRFEHCRLNLFGRAMLNPDRIHKDNLFVPISQRVSGDNDRTPHITGTIGVGLWL